MFNKLYLAFRYYNLCQLSSQTGVAIMEIMKPVSVYRELKCSEKKKSRSGIHICKRHPNKRNYKKYQLQMLPSLEHCTTIKSDLLNFMYEVYSSANSERCLTMFETQSLTSR